MVVGFWLCLTLGQSYGFWEQYCEREVSESEVEGTLRVGRYVVDRGAAGLSDVGWHVMLDSSKWWADQWSRICGAATKFILLYFFLAEFLLMFLVLR